MALAIVATPTASALAQRHDHHGSPAMGPRGGPPPAWGRAASAPPREMSPYDPRQHNGYWVGQRWYYGPPPGTVVREPGFRPGFTPFRPGAFLPPQYEGAVIDDYARFHLRRPPYGYRWVQAGDEFLLVSMSTGQIFDVVTGF